MNMQEKVKLDNYFKSLNLEEDILIDPTTKTINKTQMISYANYLIKNNKPYTLAIINIDNFKDIDDKYGYLIGDKILYLVAEQISEVLPKDGYIGKIGGDEFLVIIENINNYDSEYQIYKTIIEAIRKPLLIDGVENFSVTATIGASCFPKDGNGYEELFLKADKALYRGKTKGRNCYIVYVDAKHSNLSYQTNVSLARRMAKLKSIFSNKNDKYLNIYNSIAEISKIMGIDGGMIYEFNDQSLSYVKDNKFRVAKPSQEVFEENFKEDFIVVNDASKLDSKSRLRFYIRENNLKSMIILRIKWQETDFGYLTLFNEQIRIWQENELALGCFLADLISFVLYMK